MSYALTGSGRVSSETRQRILKVADELGYRGPHRRGVLRTGRKTIAAVLSANLYEERHPNYFVAELLAGVEAAASQAGIEVVIGFWDEQAPIILTRHDLLGVLYLGADFSASQVDRVTQRSVIVGSYLLDSQITAVVGDNRLGARLATKELITGGCRRIALVNGQLAAPTSGDKYLGYVDALTDAGLLPQPRDILHVDFSVNAGVDAAESLLASADRPDGIVTGDDVIAFGIMRVARRNGLSIPHDLALTGYGDSHASRSTDPPLSTVRVFQPMMGRLAVRHLLSEHDPSVGSAQRTMVIPEFVRRGTTPSPGPVDAASQVLGPAVASHAQER